MTDGGELTASLTDADVRARFSQLGPDLQPAQFPEVEAAYFDDWLAEHDRHLIDLVTEQLGRPTRPKRGRPRSTVTAPPPLPPMQPADLPPEDLPPESATEEEWIAWFHSLPLVTVKARRDELMAAGIRAGLTLEQVGALYGVTRERARQIVKTRGVVPSEVARERKEKATRLDTILKERVCALSRQHPGMDVDELATLAEVSPERARRFLGPRLPIHDGPRQPARTDQLHSDDKLLEGLAQFAAENENTTVENYNAWAQGHNMPTAQTLAKRFGGGWNGALEAVGITNTTTGGLRPVISDTELWATLVTFFRSEQPAYTFGHFDIWTARSPQLPSGALIRLRLGGWNDTWPTVRKLLRYAEHRDGSWPWADEILDTHPGEAPRNTATRDDALACLQRVAQLAPEGTLTVQKYQEARSDDDLDPPTIQHLLGGSWTTALLYADLADRLSPKSLGKLRRGKVPLPDDLLEVAASLNLEHGPQSSAIASLRRVADRAPEGELTMAVYTEHREPNDTPVTSIPKAFGGSWSAALYAAALEDRLSSRAKRMLRNGTTVLPKDLAQQPED